MNRLQNKTAIVTGAAGGIGLATAKLFLAEGANVVATDCNDVLLKLNLALEKSPALRLISSDVVDEEDWQRTFEEAVQHFGRVDVLVNNAGIAAQGTIEDTDLMQWRQVIQTNLDSVFLGCKYGVLAMKESGGGSIVNISSTAALKASLVGPAYGASKAGIWNLTRTVALYCAKQGYNIRCNSLHPGITETPLIASASEEVISQLKAGVPMGKLAEPGDIAQAALYLAGDESQHTTGATLVVDGGALIQ